MVEAELMNNVYAEFAENFMAMPVIKGLKTESERFAGALETFCIEGLMQDGKALQAGTSHFLGQNFAKAFDVKFTNKEGKQDYVWATSWGVSTRLMGALIMTHSDDKGLVLPPNLAPNQVVIVPIYKNDEQFDAVSEVANNIMGDLKSKGVSVKFDNRTTHRPGAKFAQHELQGVPLRIAIGPKDLENGTVELARRDTLTKEVVALDSLVDKVVGLMTEIQNSLHKKALDFRNDHITKVDSLEEFKDVLENKTGFISAHWDGTNESEEKIKEITKATIRCIPMDNIAEDGKCIYSGNPSKQRVLFAKAY
jgi:prolyl-tRNA synthetase